MTSGLILESEFRMAVTLPVTETKVRVGKTTYGRGVFARRVIRKGSKIGNLSGRIIDDPSYGSEYCIDLGGTRSFEPRAPFRFLNHCCEPNCKLWLIEQENKDGTPKPPKLELHALRSIPVGEELRIDYAWGIENAIPCLCGVATCRGWVVAVTECNAKTGRFV